jgi:polyvinyl alcohol dehydrogenase (cytochrome)
MHTLRTACCIGVLLIASQAHPQGVAHPGQAVYERACSGCHNNPEATRAPSLASLRTLNRSTVEYAINIGYMKMQAKDLSAQERTEVLDWLSIGQAPSGAWLARAKCVGKAANVEAAARPIAATFGIDLRNSRRQSARQAGLATADFAKLELAWAVGFPQTPTMRSQPVVVGDTVYVAATDAGRLVALDSASGCIKWQYESAVPLRSSLSYLRMLQSAGCGDRARPPDRQETLDRPHYGRSDQTEDEPCGCATVGALGRADLEHARDR